MKIICKDFSLSLPGLMIRGAETILKTNVNVAARLCVGFVLIIYSSVFLFSPAIAPHGGHDHAWHEADSCEKDPCHISIYHPGLVGGCQHKFHYSQSPEKCPWCDLSLVFQISPEHSGLKFHGIHFSPADSDQIPVLPFLIANPHSDRGPPV